MLMGDVGTKILALDMLVKKFRCLSNFQMGMSSRHLKCRVQERSSCWRNKFGSPWHIDGI